MNSSGSWFGAKCLFHHQNISTEVDEIAATYEERVILVKAIDFDWAIKKAEKDAKAYVRSAGDCEYLGYVSCFEIFDSEIAEFTEVYSLMRKSTLEPDEYITRFYDNGDECTTDADADAGIDAEVTAMGPFSPDVVEHLEQESRYYKGMPPGKSVLVTGLFWSNGKEESLKLAACLGISLLDFERHDLDTERVNTFMLNRSFGEVATKRFIALRDHGFRFFFTPYIDNPGLLDDE